VIVNGGQIYKRIMPRARGTAYRINKRTSHIEIELDKLINNESKKAKEDDKKVKKEDKKVKTKKNES